MIFEGAGTVCICFHDEKNQEIMSDIHLEDSKNEEASNPCDKTKHLVYSYGYTTSEDENDDPPFPTVIVDSADKISDSKATPKKQKNFESQQAILRRSVNIHAISQVYQVAMNSYTSSNPPNAPNSIFTGLLDDNESDEDEDPCLDVSEKQLLGEERILCDVAFDESIPPS